MDYHAYYRASGLAAVVRRQMYIAIAAADLFLPLMGMVRRKKIKFMPRESFAHAAFCLSARQIRWWLICMRCPLSEMIRHVAKKECSSNSEKCEYGTVLM